MAKALNLAARIKCFEEPALTIRDLREVVKRSCICEVFEPAVRR